MNKELPYPKFTVINAWTKNNWIKQWPNTEQGLHEAINYCKLNNLSCVRYCTSSTELNIAWNNYDN